VKNRRAKNTSLIKGYSYSVPLLGLLFTINIVFSVFLYSSHTGKMKEKFGKYVSEARAEIEERLRIYIEVVRGGRALFAASDEVTRKDWNEYINSTDILNRYPGIFGLQFCRFVKHKNKDKYIRQVQNDTSLNPVGYPDFKIHPEGKREYYVVVDYNEPFEQNKMAFGYDIISEPIRKRATERSRDTGRLTFSGKLMLLEQEVGFLIYFPVYKNGMPVNTAKERKMAFQGVILAVFAINKLMDGVLGFQLENNLYFEIHDGYQGDDKNVSILPASDTLMYKNTDMKTNSKGKYLRKEILRLGGRRWFIYFFPKEKFNDAVSANPAYFIFPAGLLISLFLFFFVRTLEKEAKIAKQLEEANKKLQFLSSQDGLTEISNRRHFDLFLDNEWRRCLRDQKPISLIMADLDFFKNYNDGYGHHAGDKCLKAVAKVLQKEVNRPGDIAARYGGEEFVLIFSGSDLHSTTAIAERLRLAVKGLKIPHGYSEVCQFVTISLGVATVVPKQWLKKEKLMKMADEALYNAKQEGRNRVKQCVL